MAAIYPTKPKFCIDCKYHKLVDAKWEIYRNICTYDKNYVPDFDLVSGELLNPNKKYAGMCYDLRRDENKCDKNANWYVAKTQDDIFGL